MKNKKLFFIIIIILLLISVCLAISLGSSGLKLEELFKIENRQILYLRLSRVFLGIVAGAGLAVAGVLFQGILRNPLAEPYVLGVSSGAGLGAVLAICFGLSAVFLPFCAFLGAGLTMIAVYNLAKINGRVFSHGLLLSGVVVSAIFSSLLLFFVSISPNEAMHSITWWLLGSLQVFDFKLSVTCAMMVTCGISVAFYFARDLNAISLGEEEALHLGVDSESVSKILFTVASLVTGSIVCVCGIIGFVGLIIPHAIRLVLGSDHKVVLPASAISAAVFLILADTLSRVLMAPVEIPIGVITALLGGPVFIFLLRKRQKHLK
ncbi:MAG: iron ABC transporter permease [Candidatus Omnitrophica bacterium]|nr:iron ABC transporter permease [Candidatus Omnitrophota bacterium]